MRLHWGNCRSVLCKSCDLLWTKKRVSVDEQANRCYQLPRDLTDTVTEVVPTVPPVPDFSVVVWVRETDRFSVLKSELLAAVEAEPYESTHYQGMVDFHWAASSLAEAKRLAEGLRDVARHPEVVLLRVLSIDGTGSISIKDERHTKH
jgi:hypothetical protein